MKIAEFRERYGANPRKIEGLISTWQLQQIDFLLQKLDEDYIGAAVIIGDAVHGDGIRDQISADLRDAFANLMKEKASTYKEMRRILAEKITNPDGGYFEFDDRSVVGFVSKLKGQIGENEFLKIAGGGAELAASGSQEGWDVAVRNVDGSCRYVQVKLYESHSAVVSKIKEVHSKVLDGVIEGCDGEPVPQIDFAVPENIADRVSALIAEKYPELANIEIHRIPLSAASAAGLVEEGLARVGPEQLEHLFGELLNGAFVGASLHALVNGFLWYKGAKDFANSFADAASSTSLTVAQMGLNFAADAMFDSLAGGLLVGGSARFVLSRFAKSRWAFADFLEESVDRSQKLLASLSAPTNAAMS